MALKELSPFKNFFLEELSLNRLDEISSRPTQEKSEVFQYQISFLPKFLRKDINGDFVRENNSISKGSFNVKIELVEYLLDKEQYYLIGKIYLMQLKS